MERFSYSRGDLFAKGMAEDLFKGLEQDMQKKIQSLTDDKILNVSEDEYIDYLISEYSLETPVIDFDHPTIEHRTVLIPNNYPSNFPDIPREKECLCIRYYVDYKGDSELLRYHPSTWLSSGSGHFTISGHRLYTDILAETKDTERVKRDFESEKDSAKRILAYLDNEINAFNRNVPEKARHLFTSRKNEVKAKYAFISDLGVPTTAVSKEPQTYSVQAVSRRVKEPEVGRGIGIVSHQDPAIDETQFQQILNALYSLGAFYEKHPNVTYNMNENALRDLFLGQLQTTFSSDSAVGEAFNLHGKTDIMLKHGDGVLFVAECKFWNGKDSLLNAITQLLGYLSWRETKAALLIFSRGISLSTVIESIKKNVPFHPNYLSLESHLKESWFNYRFVLNQDQSRQVHLAIQVFDFSNKA